MSNLSEEEIIDRIILLLQCYVELKEDNEKGHASAYEMQFEDFEAIQGLLDLYNKEKEKNIPLIIDGKSINAYADEIEDLLSIEDGTPVYFSIGEKQAIKIISQYCRNSVPKSEIKEIENLKYELQQEKEKNKECIKTGDLERAVGFLMNNNDLSNYISKEKIKAKIEEVKDGTFDAKIVLQSLLEKE